MRRRLPVGAELISEDLAHFHVWAPAAQRVAVVTPAGEIITELDQQEGGFFSARARAKAGDRYFFRLNEGNTLYPDPASRFQPDGPHAASELIDPSAFQWTDHEWRGASLEGQILYELHVGTFTREGTWEAASRQLPELARLGITVIEVMPIAEFEGRFGWGYDGVDLFAPSHLYGRPDDLRRFIDSAHAVGVAVILDVVYNHLGPVGNYLRTFSPAYFTDRYVNEWGDAINFDGEGSGPVRDFFVANAGYWIDEFHFDGLRLDATQSIFDRSPTNVLALVGAKVRECAKGRSTIVVAENEPQVSTLLEPIASGGCGLDALWNDDFHHSAMVALTGRREAYYSDTYGVPQEFISAAKYGFLYQGQHYHWQRASRGVPSLDLLPAHFITFLQNHDQVANSARGVRGHFLTSAGRWRAMTTLLLLMPSTPMLFQGQEFSASSPFLFFADFEADLARAVRAGREDFLSQFSSLVSFMASTDLDLPGDVRTFEQCKLDFSERETHADTYALHRDLIALRRRDTAFERQRKHGVDGAVLSSHAFVLRFFADTHRDDRLLVINLGASLHRDSFAEPLLAPPAKCQWRVEWSSDHPTYGGNGLSLLWPNGQWTLPAESAIVLEPYESRPHR